MMLRRLGIMLVLSSVGTWACASDETDDDAASPDQTEAGSTDDSEDDGEDAGETDEGSASDDAESEGGAEAPDLDAGVEPEDAGEEGGNGFGAQAIEGGAFESDASLTPATTTFSVTGQLKVGTTLFVDTDTPNIDNPRISNDDIDVEDASQDRAQQISSPSTIGGYLGPLPVLDDEGEPTGEFVMDDYDFYKVTLAANQTVTLFIAQPPADEDQDVGEIINTDLDLYLLDAQRATIKDEDISDENPVDFVDDSQGTGNKEQVTAPSTGVYWIAVERYDDEETTADDAGQALYSLSVGIGQSDDVQDGIESDKLSSKTPFVPGEAVVQLGFGPQSASLAAKIAAVNGPDATGFQLVGLTDVVSDVSPQSTANQARETIRAIKRLRKMTGVVNASPNYIYQTLGTPASDDPLLGSQWHYDQINLAEAWLASDQSSGARGAGVVVAVIDTGVAMSHPDFENADGSSQLTDTGFDMISDPEVAADGDGRDSDPDDPGDARISGASSFHGSHCAGTVAASTNNGEGAAGVAPNARIMPIRALGRGGGTLEDIRQSILYAAGLDNATGELPAQAADIISMSLGGPGRSDAMASAIAAAMAEGVIVIAAAGNSNAPAEGFSPAGEDGVITVAATDLNRDKAFYSNFGLSNGVIDVSAPGGDTGADANRDGQPDGVVSLVFKDNGSKLYDSYQGTSMACPHVAGVAALMKAIWPEMGPEEFRAALPDIVVDIGDEGEDPVHGHGLINANKAVAFAMTQAGEEVSDDPVLSVSSSILDYGGSNVSLPLAIGNTGRGELEIGEVSVSEEWVQIDGQLDVGSNLVNIVRSGLAEGVNTASITIESNGGSKVISVRVFVGEEPIGGNLGIIYVMMVDPVTGEQLAQEAAFPEDDYTFELTDIPGGKYYLVAGTDLRDTFFLGNDGDGYGAFPLAQDPQLICRFLEEEDPECPIQSEEDRESPDLEDVLIPIQYLLDIGAEQVDDEEVLPAGVSAKANALTRPTKFRRMW